MKIKFNPSKLLNLIRRDDLKSSDATIQADESDDELSDEETEDYRTKLDDQMRERAETILEEMETRNSWKLPRPVKRFLSLSMLLLSAFLGIFIINQVVIFSNEIRSMPALWCWPAVIFFAIFTLIIIGVIVLLCWKLISLQRNQQINPEALRVLSERYHLQQVAAEKKQQALIFLNRYLKNYPVDRKDRRRLIKLGLKPEEWLRVTTAIDSLRAQTEAADIDLWLSDFKTNFQKTLDSFAKRRIRQYALKVGSGTALSPVSIVDQMIVFYGCAGLIKELLLIYNLCPAWGQSWIILSRSIIHTYLSGVIEGATETAADAGADAISEFMGDSFHFLTGTIGRAVGARTAEATLNGLLIWRLGKAIMNQLQPIRV